MLDCLSESYFGDVMRPLVCHKILSVESCARKKEMSIKELRESTLFKNLEAQAKEFRLNGTKLLFKHNKNDSEYRKALKEVFCGL